MTDHKDRNWIWKLGLVILLGAVLFGFTQVKFNQVAYHAEKITGEVTTAITAYLSKGKH